ncbi:hypothetical protein A2U01_0053363, partial [Trifolium medium]|nr:hypothetical protein [Trifolium medium]
MAPKKAPAPKKQKTAASSSRAAPPFDAERFLGPVQLERYQALQNRKLWPEKKFDIIPDGEYRSFVEAIDYHKWGKLLDPPHPINDDFVREFYTNATQLDPTEPFSFTTMVRGRTIHFDRDAINDYLGNPYTLA